MGEEQWPLIFEVEALKMEEQLEKQLVWLQEEAEHGWQMKLIDVDSDRLLQEKKERPYFLWELRVNQYLHWETHVQF